LRRRGNLSHAAFLSQPEGRHLDLPCIGDVNRDFIGSRGIGVFIILEYGLDPVPVGMQVGHVVRPVLTCRYAFCEARGEIRYADTHPGDRGIQVDVENTAADRPGVTVLGKSLEVAGQ